jgi:hypothetical protein
MQKTIPEKNKRWNAAHKRLPKDKKAVLIEVGVWFPKFSKAIMPYLPKLYMVLIDRWTPPGKDDSYAHSQSEISEKSQEEYNDALEQCKAVSKKYDGRITIYKMDSVKAANCLEDGSCDMIFIDGDHSYQGCKRDIVAYLPKVKKGGWIGGHDYAHPDQGEVKRAVDEFVKANNLKLQLDCNRTWWVKV